MPMLRAVIVALAEARSTVTANNREVATVTCMEVVLSIIGQNPGFKAQISGLRNTNPRVS